MDQKTHDIRLANWKTIINNCEDRPEGQSKRQLRFAPPSGHRCVCRRTLGGDNGQHFNQLLSVQSLRCSVSSRA